ncbi:MAG: glucose-1-phosphate cytidylyltransferase, partial [Holophagales bacterium]|nr:glucose-1-phosphate cytidylyltransferase [Holophagales bacterium]
GGRLKRVRHYLDPEEPFCFTYGDGVADVNVTELVRFHRKAGTLATMTAIQPPSRFGVLAFDGDRIEDFEEKPHGEGGWINGGFFVLDPAVIRYIESDGTPWEHAPMRRLVQEGQLSAYLHRGFWQCMDTLRDKNTLQTLWDEGRAPWKVW